MASTFGIRLARLLRLPLVALVATCDSDQTLSPDRSRSVHTLDATPPTVAITAPAAGTVVSSPTTITADASDDVLMGGVEFFFQGVSLGAEDDTAPYEAVLNTDTLPAGTGDLTARARDDFGNTTLSDPVSITVFHPDTTPPTVAITAPAEGSILTAPTTVTADASDDFQLAGVRFQANGIDLDLEDDTAPYESALNTDTLQDGSYELVAIARDTAGNLATSATVNVTVTHPDETFPTVTITSPQDGAVVTGTVSITADASDDVGVAGVQFRLNGNPTGAEDVTAPYAVDLDTDPLAAGSIELTAVARDEAGNVTLSAAVTVTVFHPDVTPPTVAITAPLNGATVTAPMTVTADASDNGLVAGVTFKLNGIDLASEDLTAPYEATLNTDTLPDGSFNLSAVARDTANNSATSSPVQFSVLHPDVTPPTVAITSPLSGATVTGVVTVTADASDDQQVAGVQFRVGGVNFGTEDQAAPYSAALDTYTLPNGSVSLTAFARDTAGNTTLSDPVSVTVDNPPPRNVVVIVTDDMRWDHLQYMPLTTAALGSQAVTFSNAFASTPLCCPTRATLLTGKYSHNHGVLTNAAPTGGATKFNATSTLPTWLHDAGYRTGIAGKYMNEYQLLSPAIPPGWDDFQVFVFPDGFKAYFNYEVNENGTVRTYGTGSQDYSTTVFATKAVNFINSTPANRSFMLFYTPFAPHQPAVPHPSDVGRFASFPKWRPPSYNEAIVTDKTNLVKQTPRFTTAQINNSDNLHKKMLESLQAVDRGVQSIVQALQASNRWDNTLIVFLSDNGLAWGENRMLDRKSCPYEACIRIPMIVRMPGVAPRTETKLVSTVDLAPTIAAWAGVTPPMTTNGLSLLPLLTNPGASWRTELLIEQLGYTPTYKSFYSVRNDRYIYTEYLSGEKELYDLQTDPYQLTNVVNNSSYSSIRTSLAAILKVLKTS